MTRLSMSLTMGKKEHYPSSLHLRSRATSLAERKSTTRVNDFSSRGPRSAVGHGFATRHLAGRPARLRAALRPSSGPTSASPRGSRKPVRKHRHCLSLPTWGFRCPEVALRGAVPARGPALEGASRQVAFTAAGLRETIHRGEERGALLPAERRGVPPLRGQAEEESERGVCSGEAGKAGRKPACAGDATARGPASPPLTASRTRPWRAGLGLCTGVRAVPSPWSQKAASGGLVVNLRHSFGQPDVSRSPLGAFGKGFCVFWVFFVFFFK